MLRIFYAFVAFLVLLTSTAFAATVAEPAMRKVVFEAGYPWREGLILKFEADEERCRARYGSQWRAKCAAALGRPGDTEKNIKLVPAARGHWQWRDSTTLAFIPTDASSLKPATSYTAYLEAFHHPAAITIDASKATLGTLPLSVQLLSSNFLIDPSPAAIHRITAEFEFNYPVPAGASILDIQAPQDARFGKPELVWNEDRDHLNLSVPVTKLPSGSSQASLLFKNTGQIAVQDGTLKWWGPARFNNALTFRQNMPGNGNLFRINKVHASQELDINLDATHILNIETSLYTQPEELACNLQILELPKYNTGESIEPYKWSSAPAISVDILKKSKKLDAVSLQKDNAPQSRFKFRINANSGSYILVAIGKDLKSASSQSLNKPWVDIIEIGNASPRLGFMQPGNMLVMDSSGILNIYASDLDRIEWEAQIVRKPFLALLAASSWNSFENPLGSSSLGMDAISERSKGNIKLVHKGDGKANFASLDLAGVLKNAGRQSGLVNVKLAGYRNGEPVAEASRLILASNLGLMLKKSADGALDCFTHRLNNGEAAANAKVFILGINGKTVASALTDDRGHAVLPSIAGLKRESRPVAAVAQLDGDLAWLPLEDKSRELNYSEFPIGGVSADSSGSTIYVFGQRGMYRPGDTLYFGCLARNGDFSQLAGKPPFFAEILDPRGIKIWEKIFRPDEFGLTSLEWKTDDNILSGKYTLNVRHARNSDILASTVARIEEFQPDTLKMKIDVPAVNGWLPSAANTKAADANIFTVSLQNLYGTAAANHKVIGTLQTAPAVFNFKGYEDFTFMDSAPFAGQGISRQLPEAITDANGRSSLALPNDIGITATALASIFAEGFEADGGRATSAKAAIIVSPMQKILGYRPRGSLTNLNYITQNSDAPLEFVVLDHNLERVNWQDLEFSLEYCRYVTNLVSDGMGGYRYDEVPLNSPIKTWRQNIPAEGARVALDTSDPGEYLLVTRDNTGKIVARIPYVVAGERLLPPDSAPAAGKMRLRIDREEYNSGDKAKLYLSLPYDGTGLITLERDGVAAFERFSAKAGECVREFEIPADFEGRGYIVVSYTRSVDSPAIYMAPHTYAIAPILANVNRRDLNLKIDAPAKVMPGKNLRLELTSREKGHAILFAVDEGILQLTGYQAPKPLNALLADRALDVRTMQALDLVMPEYGKIQSRISAFGGGMERIPFGTKFANPFKRRNEPPATFWSAIVAVGPEKTVLDVPIPEYYNGSLRIMAVAASAGCAGSASRQVTVAAPLIMTPVLPLAVAPNDIFEGGILAANTTDKEINALISISLPKSLELLDDGTRVAKVRPVRIAAGSEVLVPFKIRALDIPGAVSVDFLAQENGKNVERSGWLSVRPAILPRTTVQAGVIAESATISSSRLVYPWQAASKATISAIPIPLAKGFASYLDTYPYGCTEQLVSKSFAHILMRPWLREGSARDAGEKLLEATISAIRSRFNGNGVGLWPNSAADFLLTAYAADFLLSLREAGNTGGDDILAQLCSALEDNCALNEASIFAARNCAYAIWVLARSGRITTQLIENLVKAMSEFGIKGWQNDITALLLAASQREMRITKTLRFGNIEYSPQGYFDEYGLQALQMILLARYFPDKCNAEMKNAFYDSTIMALMNNGYATFSANLGIRAIMSLALAGNPSLIQARIQCVDYNGSADEAGRGGNGQLEAGGAMYTYEAPQCRAYRIDMAPNTDALFWQISSTGYDRQAPQTAEAHGLEIEKKFLNSAGEEIDFAKQGEEITVRITARSMSANAPDCVIADLLPCGFEMIVNGKEARLPEEVKFVNRREDRMVFFADLSSEPLILSYKVRPVSRGRFTVPPVYGEAMYDHGCYGNGKSGSLEIK